MSMNSLFHLRGYSSSPCSLTAEATTIFTICALLEMYLGDRPPSSILPTSFFMAALLTESSGRSPMFGLIQMSNPHDQPAIVDGANGLRLRLRMPSSQAFACSRNVTAAALDCVTTLSKYSCVSTLLPTMISLALRSRSDAESLPGPEMGQILA